MYLVASDSTEASCLFCGARLDPRPKLGMAKVVRKDYGDHDHDHLLDNLVHESELVDDFQPSNVEPDLISPHQSYLLFLMAASL